MMFIGYYIHHIFVSQLDLAKTISEKSLTIHRDMTNTFKLMVAIISEWNQTTSYHFFFLTYSTEGSFILKSILMFECIDLKTCSKEI